jgi:hypothetical protein
MEEKGIAYKVLARKPQGKYPFERPRCRRDNTTTDLRDIGREGMYAIHLPTGSVAPISRNYVSDIL